MFKVILTEITVEISTQIRTEIAGVLMPNTISYRTKKTITSLKRQLSILTELFTYVYNMPLSYSAGNRYKCTNNDSHFIYLTIPKLKILHINKLL